MGGNLSVKIQYIPKTGTINQINLPSRVEEFSGTSSDLFVPSSGQRFFQLSNDNNPANGSYGLEENIAWRGTSAEKYNGFVSFTKANKDNIFENASDVTINFTGSNIEGFTIYFDGIAEQWATELTVNGVTYINTNPIFSWRNSTISSATIVLKKWNRPNVSARIPSIAVGLEIEYDRDRFILVQRGLQSISDNTTLSWGVLGQYGAISIIDVDKEIKDLAVMGILKSGTRIPITINLDGKIIGSSIGNRWSYEFNNNIVTTDLVTNMDILNNTIYSGYAPQENKTNIEIFNDLKTLTERNGITVRLFASNITDYFNRINQSYLEMKQSSLLDAWTKFCNDTATRIYFNELGEMTLIEYV